ncbi:MAG: isoleucine--tRNA ligase [Coriobacteriales bacterium]|nr:isoleucine--tRNA ligase [Coriobacteriales bacterium]
MANDYKSSMNLPKTDFPMRAGLPKSEPIRLKKWEETNIYERVLEKNKDGEHYVLHDGPPYANGPIHIGHAFNKILKDIVVKYKSQQGFYAPYTPGWDCHGQPIEHMVEEKLGPVKMKQIDRPTLRRLCRDWAMKHVDLQREGFKRLGVRGDWDNPYLTLTHDYEVGNVEIFKKMYEDGAVYRGRKPVHWCKHCHTALAEAEIEYGDEVSPSIYVKFRLLQVPEAFDAIKDAADLVIWTTTPWTLPANTAVSLAPDAGYVAVLKDGQALIMAEALVPAVGEVCGWQDEPVFLMGDDGEPVRVKGVDFAGMLYVHPILEGETGVMIYGDHVDLSTGTGAVHTAPGHGADDYLVGLKFDVRMRMPVDDNGVLTKEAGRFAGISVDEANKVIPVWLAEQGTLLASLKISHSYPHCWRCHEPVIFRATDQWFVSMDKTGLRQAALDQIDAVKWVPAWASNRIGAMVADRPDWCISRQRSWGVPIPVFKCGDCSETIATPATFDAVIDLFAREGADAWYTHAPADYLPADTCCPRCGSKNILPEKDILDVWWESGVSHTSVCDKNPRLHRPADLYLEGSDQHRGWFQSALLTSVGAYGIAPYKAVMSCGFIVDEQKRKMSKSLGNGVDPADVIAKSGADVLRLWVGSVDYSQDVSISDQIVQRSSDAYRNIRNTFRFLLGNLYDFDDQVDAVSYDEMLEVDRWAMARIMDLTATVTDCYENLSFHTAYRAISDYTSELSSVYMDMLKDRLYSAAAKSVERRSAQTALMNILEALVRLWAPILTFTCDEVWDYYPEPVKAHRDPAIDSVQLAGWPHQEDFVPQIPADERKMLLASYEQLFKIRDVVCKALEEARAAKVINKSQEAIVHVNVPASMMGAITPMTDLAELFIVSKVELATRLDGDETVFADVEVAQGDKCPRCWNIRELGADGLCERCAAVMKGLEA